MNIDVKEYIASGILEAYAIGQCSAKEQAEVEAAVAQHPELKRELQAIEDTLANYAMQHSVTPSAGLKDKIMGAIQDDKQATEERPVRQMNKMEYEEKADPRNKAIWSIAASVLLMISLISNLYVYQRMQNAEGYVFELLKKTHRKDSMLNVATAQNIQSQKDLAILKDPMYKMVTLKGMDKTPDAKAMVCFCPGDKIVYFEADNMPAAPKGMQYQLWAIVDGKPVDEGMIIAGQGLHKMKDLDQATAFAVTLEKEGGSPTPKGDMIVMGSMTQS